MDSSLKVRDQIDFESDAPEVARSLIGCEFMVGSGLDQCGGVIIETEAYTSTDEASHSFRGPSDRNRAMYMPAGTLYVYKIYGLHLCLNSVCGKSDGQAVLIRALEPTLGIQAMQSRRKVLDAAKLCNGPANLVVALGISKAMDQRPMLGAGIEISPPKNQPLIAAGSRLGIRRATELPWRFYLDVKLKP